MERDREEVLDSASCLFGFDHHSLVPKFPFSFIDAVILAKTIWHSKTRREGKEESKKKMQVCNGDKLRNEDGRVQGSLPASPQVSNRSSTTIFTSLPFSSLPANLTLPLLGPSSRRSCSFSSSFYEARMDQLSFPPSFRGPFSLLYYSSLLQQQSPPSRS